MDTSDAHRLVLYKRWKLRAGTTHEDVRRIVGQRIQPAYRLLSCEVTLGLELGLDGLSVVAIQRWSSSEAHDAAVSGEHHARWWADYELLLREWDSLVEIADEWGSLDVDLEDG